MAWKMESMQLDLRLLEVFCAVYSELSFSKAGEKLHISQPTVSSHIRSLEDTLGVRLFDRLPRQIVPTAAGRLLYRHGETILNQRRIALQEIQAFLERMEGNLIISASTVPGEYLLPELTARFCKQHSGAELELRISDSKTAAHEVARGISEIGFVGAHLPVPGVKYELLGSDELVVIGPPGNPPGPFRRTLEELAREPFLAREPGSGTRITFEERIGRNLDEFNIVARFTTTNAIKEAVKAGLGFSVVSYLAVRSELERGLVRQVRLNGVGPLHRDLYLVVAPRLTLSPLAEKFLEYSRRQVPRG